MRLLFSHVTVIAVIVFSPPCLDGEAYGDKDINSAENSAPAVTVYQI